MDAPDAPWLLGDELVRLTVLLEAVDRELASGPFPSDRVDQLADVCEWAFDEVGHDVSASLRVELGRLSSPPLAEPPSVAEARVVIAQLRGWTAGALEAALCGLADLDDLGERPPEDGAR